MPGAQRVVAPRRALDREQLAARVPSLTNVDRRLRRRPARPCPRDDRPTRARGAAVLDVEVPAAARGRPTPCSGRARACGSSVMVSPGATSVCTRMWSLVAGSALQYSRSGTSRIDGCTRNVTSTASARVGREVDVAHLAVRLRASSLASVPFSSRTPRQCGQIVSHDRSSRPARVAWSAVRSSSCSGSFHTRARSRIWMRWRSASSPVRIQSTSASTHVAGSLLGDAAARAARRGALRASSASARRRQLQDIAGAADRAASASAGSTRRYALLERREAEPDRGRAERAARHRAEVEVDARARRDRLERDGSRTSPS